MAYAVVSIGMVCAFAHAEGGVLKARPAFGGGSGDGWRAGQPLAHAHPGARHPSSGGVQVTIVMPRGVRRSYRACGLEVEARCRVSDTYLGESIFSWDIRYPPPAGTSSPGLSSTLASFQFCPLLIRLADACRRNDLLRRQYRVLGNTQLIPSLIQVSDTNIAPTPARSAPITTQDTA